jgi:hypothetical protein
MRKTYHCVVILQDRDRWSMWFMGGKCGRFQIDTIGTSFWRQQCGKGKDTIRTVFGKRMLQAGAARAESWMLSVMPPISSDEPMG